MASTSQRTKGPWEMDKARERGRVTWQIVAEDGDAAVATVAGMRGCMVGRLRPVPPGEDEANALLIAAAPALLEALRQIREAVCSGMGTLPADDIERAEAAIRQAEGRQ